MKTIKKGTHNYGSKNPQFEINIRKNDNKYNAAYGKYYAEADSKEPLNLKGFAKHLSEHGKLEMTGDRYLSGCLRVTQVQWIKEPSRDPLARDPLALPK